MCNECEKHGQHFAGLERDLEKERERADKFMWQVRDTCVRAEKAEARLDEIEHLSAAISRDCNDCANQRNAANARCAELEREVTHWKQFYDESCDVTREWIASNDVLASRVREAEGLLRQVATYELDISDFHNKPILDRIAAFLAARG